MRGYANGSGPSDADFAATLDAMDTAPTLTRVQLVQAHDMASKQRANFTLLANEADARGDTDAANAWDMESEKARQRQRDAFVALHGLAAERLRERVVSVRVLDVAARKRCREAFRVMAQIEADRTGM